MKVGFIGLGIMGRPMCANLIKAGHELVVYDFNAESMKKMEELGARKGENAADVARKCPVVITMLPNSPHVRQAVLGENGVLEGASGGSALIDMSSIDPSVTREIGEALQARGVEMLDAPVSGGEPKAVDGSISVMVGGKKEVFEKYRGLLADMSGNVTYVGELGAGNVVKLANQMIVALNIAAVSEALVFAKKAGVSPELVYRAIRGGLAGSTVLDAKAPMMMKRDFTPGFRVELHIKDLLNAQNLSHQLGVATPFTAQVLEVLMSLRTDGLDKEDHSSIVKYFEKLSGILCS